MGAITRVLYHTSCDAAAAADGAQQAYASEYAFDPSTERCVCKVDAHEHGTAAFPCYCQTGSTAHSVTRRDSQEDRGDVAEERQAGMELDKILGMNVWQRTPYLGCNGTSPRCMHHGHCMHSSMEVAPLHTARLSLHSSSTAWCAQCGVACCSFGRRDAWGSHTCAWSMEHLSSLPTPVCIKVAHDDTDAC